MWEVEEVRHHFVRAKIQIKYVTQKSFADLFYSLLLNFILVNINYISISLVIFDEKKSDRCL